MAADVLELSYQRVNRLVGQLVDLGVLRRAPSQTYGRRFYAPRVLNALVED